LQSALSADSFWEAYLEDFAQEKSSKASLHVAVFQQPFLGWVLDGSKPVESRFSQRAVVPYGSIRAGDAVAVKEVAGPVVGIAHVRTSTGYRLDPRTWHHIRSEFADLLRATDAVFWEARAAARFATLIYLDQVRAVAPIRYAKSDRRGWVVECGPSIQQSFEL
jgi:hypothetical protein